MSEQAQRLEYWDHEQAKMVGQRPDAAVEGLAPELTAERRALADIPRKYGPHEEYISEKYQPPFGDDLMNGSGGEYVLEDRSPGFGWTSALRAEFYDRYWDLDSSPGTPVPGIDDTRHEHLIEAMRAAMPPDYSSDRYYYSLDAHMTAYDTVSQELIVGLVLNQPPKFVAPATMQRAGWLATDRVLDGHTPTLPTAATSDGGPSEAFRLIEGLEATPAIREEKVSTSTSALSIALGLSGIRTSRYDTLMSDIHHPNKITGLHDDRRTLQPPYSPYGRYGWDPYHTLVDVLPVEEERQRGADYPEYRRPESPEPEA